MSKQKYVIIFFFLRAIWVTILAGAIFSCNLNDDSRKYDGESKLSKIKALKGSYTAAADEDAISLKTDRRASAVSVIELLGTAALRDIGLQNSQLRLCANDSTGTLVLTIYPDGIQPPDVPDDMEDMEDMEVMEGMAKTIKITGFRVLPISQESESNNQVAQSFQEEVQSMDIGALGLDSTKRASEVSMSDVPSVLIENLKGNQQRLELLPYDSAGELYLVFFWEGLTEEQKEKVSPVAEICVVRGFKKGPAVKVKFSSSLKNLYYLGDELAISVKVQNLRENSYLKYKYRKSGVMSVGLPIAVYLGSDLVCVLAFPWDVSQATKSPEREIRFVRDVKEDRIYQCPLTLQAPNFIKKSELKILGKPRVVKYKKEFYEVDFQFGYKMHLQEIAKIINDLNNDDKVRALPEVFTEYYQLCKDYRDEHPDLPPAYIKDEMLKEGIKQCGAEIERKKDEIEDCIKRLKSQAKMNKVANTCFKIFTIVELLISAGMVVASGGAALPAFLVSLSLAEGLWIKDCIERDGKFTMGECLPTIAFDALASDLFWGDVDTTKKLGVDSRVKKEGINPTIAPTSVFYAPALQYHPFIKYFTRYKSGSDDEDALRTLTGAVAKSSKKTADITSDLGEGKLSATKGAAGITFASAASSFLSYVNAMKLGEKLERLQQQQKLLELKKEMLDSLENEPRERDTIIACEEGKHYLKASGQAGNLQDFVNSPLNFKSLKEEIEKKMRNSKNPLNKALKGRLYNIMSCQYDGKTEFIYQTIKYRHKESGAQINNYADRFYKLNGRGEIIYRASGEKVDDVLDMYGDHCPGMEHRTDDKESAEIVDYTNKLLGEHPQAVKDWREVS